MASKYRENYSNGVVICHGKSELLMSRYISSNLHLGIKHYAKDNGRHSIQITSLMSILNTNPFKNPTSFVQEYSIEETGRGKNRKLVNFKLFIIMDTDDCTEQQRQDFLSKRMFEGHWLCEYIEPIANTPCLEDVLVEAGIMPKKIRDNEKGTYYTKIFPINPKPLSDNTVMEVEELSKQIKKSRNSNLTVYIDYCLSLLDKKI